MPADPKKILGEISPPNISISEVLVRLVSLLRAIEECWNRIIVEAAIVGNGQSRPGFVRSWIWFALCLDILRFPRLTPDFYIQMQ